MNNLLLRVSLKYGFILTGFYVLCGLTITFTIITSISRDDISNLYDSYLILDVVKYLYWASFIIFLPLAHYEFNKKNENFISFKDAILIGLIVIVISQLLFTLYELYPSILITNLFYQNMGDKVEMINEPISWKDVELPIYYSLIMISYLFFIIMVESMWKINKKAGRNGWASIVPIYGLIVLFEIVERPRWYILLLLIPLIDIVVYVRLMHLLAERFGKKVGFTVGLIFLPFVFYPLLGMSKVEYISDLELHIK